MDQFIGKDKIVLVVDVEGKKTPAGEVIVSVTFESGKVEIMPKKRLELLSSETEMESIQTIIKEKVGATIFAVMNEYGIKMGEINLCLDGVVELSNNGFKKCGDILFGCEYNDLTLNKVNDILLDNFKQVNGNKTA